MKKKFFLIVLLVAVWVCGCDNFGVQEMHSSYLVLLNIDATEANLYCESKKLDIPNLTLCEEISGEITIGKLKKLNLINESDTYKIYYIPARGYIKDSKNVKIYFETNIDEKKYISELNIARLNSSDNINTESVIFKSKNGKNIKAIFVYTFRRSI